MWLLAPNQIEAALAFRGIDIGWWHRHTLDGEGFPKLSSRRLLALLDELPEMSGYKTALRGGRWPTWMHMLKELHKDTALTRASNFAGGDDPDNPLAQYTTFLDPVEAREQAQETEAEEQFHEESEAELYNILGWK